MKSLWKINLFLENGLVIALGDVRTSKPGWGESDLVKILRMEFSFMGKEYGKEQPMKLILAGMKEYNFFVEAMRSVMNNKVTIKGLWFLGKLPGSNKITGFVIQDSIKIVNATEGHEFNGGTTAGWKQGIPGTVVSTIVKEVL